MNLTTPMVCRENIRINTSMGTKRVKNGFNFGYPFGCVVGLIIMFTSNSTDPLQSLAPPKGEQRPQVENQCTSSSVPRKQPILTEHPLRGQLEVLEYGVSLEDCSELLMCSPPWRV